MDEHLDLQAHLRDALDLLERALAGGDDARHARRPGKGRAAGGGDGHLRAGVQVQLGEAGPKERGDAQVLNDGRVDAGRNGLAHDGVDLVHLLVAHEGVDRHIELDAALVAVVGGLLERRAVKVCGAGARAEQPAAHIDRVRAVLHRGHERLHLPRRGEQLHFFHVFPSRFPRHCHTV